MFTNFTNLKRKIHHIYNESIAYLKDIHHNNICKNKVCYNLSQSWNLHKNDNQVQNISESLVGERVNTLYWMVDIVCEGETAFH